MSGELDLSQLHELQRLLGADVPEIAGTLMRQLGEAVAAIDGALAATDLDAAASAAHSARNSALMIDAKPVLASLSELELCARHDDLAGARAAQAELARQWPSLRDQLEAAAAAER